MQSRTLLATLAVFQVGGTEEVASRQKSSSMAQQLYLAYMAYVYLVILHRMAKPSTTGVALQNAHTSCVSCFKMVAMLLDVSQKQTCEHVLKLAHNDYL
jgi:hypothetical protein